MSQPLVSLCLPTYNRAAALRECLCSIRQIAYAPLEVIISDNSSEDDTPAVCREAMRDDPRIRYVRQPRNLGLYGNHNVCISESRGELLCFFHDHDEHEPRMVQEYVAFLQRYPEVGIVCSDWHLIDEHGGVLGVREFGMPPVTPGLEFIEQTFRSGRCSVATPGAMIRRAALRDSRFHEQGPIGFGDFPVWFTIAETWAIGHIRQRLWGCRQLPQSQSARTIESMAHDYDANLSRYCEQHLVRWPGHERLVRRWQRLIRRYLFWALAFEVGLHYRKPGQLPPRPQTMFEIWQYRLSPEAFQRALKQVASYRTSAVEYAAYAAITTLRQLRLTGVLTWATYHTTAFRWLLKLY